MMTSDDITTTQAKRLALKTNPMQGYLFKLWRRLERRGFPTSDPLYRKVMAAYEALHTLNVEVHYMTCKRGVGRPERRDE